MTSPKLRKNFEHKMQRILHHRITQLRIVPPELSPSSKDDSLRPRVYSSPSEMKERRLRSSVRREQYYGSVELVVSVDPRGRIRNIGRFRLEPSSDFHSEQHVSTSSSIVVENPQEETRWYWKYFLGNGSSKVVCPSSPRRKSSYRQSYFTVIFLVFHQIFQSAF
uniref:Uncharacterized protein n=1 Tax=Heterorhabditis bacteriophora TaxID=37862 RepID=A0A1I7X2L8_HETBA